MVEDAWLRKNLWNSMLLNCEAACRDPLESERLEGKLLSVCPLLIPEGGRAHLATPGNQPLCLFSKHPTDDCGPTEQELLCEPKTSP